MVRNLQAIALSQVKMDPRERKKKSILSRLSSKGGALLRRRKPIQVPLCQELERWEPKTPSLHQKNPNGSSLLKGTRRDEVNLEMMVRKGGQGERHTLFPENSYVADDIASKLSTRWIQHLYIQPTRLEQQLRPEEQDPASEVNVRKHQVRRRLH